MPIDGNRIAGDPGLRPSQQPVFAQQAVDEGGFARVGPADNGELQRPGRTIFLVHRGGIGGFDFLRFFVKVGLIADDREKSAEQIGDAFAVFGRQRHRIAKAQRIGFDHAVFTR